MAFDNILIDDFCRVLPKSPSGLGIINHTSSTCSLLNFVLFYLNLLVAYLPTVFGISEIRQFSEYSALFYSHLNTSNSVMEYKVCLYVHKQMI